MGTGQWAGDVGKAAGCGVRGIWEREEKEAPVFIASTHWVSCCVLYIIYLPVAETGSERSYSDRVGIPTEDREDPPDLSPNP